MGSESAGSLRGNSGSGIGNGESAQSDSRPRVLFRPQVAYRVRQNTNTDTPIPPDEAAGTNPPDGAIINYMLGRMRSR